MLRVFRRTLTDAKLPKGIWSDFSNRSESLKLKVPEVEPTPVNRPAYHSPVSIDETFQQSYELLQQEAGELFQRANNTTNPSLKDKLLAEAESQNPHVLLNLRKESKLDLLQPVYRRHAERKWKDSDLMILMQRLEQLKVIPDTMPTLIPKVDVQIKFPHLTRYIDGLNGWITPGKILPSFLTSQPPVIKIQRFDPSQEYKKYTVVLMNPDEPDLSTNSFKTTLHFGVSNIPISLSDNTISIEKYLSEDFSLFKEYVPLLPEVNTGNQRACLWVFEQKGDIDASVTETDNFDIRAFAESNDLTAVGAHVWRQVYDRSVNEVRQKYGLPKGRVFHRVRKPYPVI